MLKATTKVVRFDRNAWWTRCEEVAKIKVKRAGKVFLETAAPLVPVWQGEARGSFLPLANYLNVVINVDGPRVSEGKQQPISEGMIISSLGQYFFKLQRKVEHLADNDVNDVSGKKPFLIHPTPWKSFEIGYTIAMINLRNKVIVGWPTITKYTKFVKGV